MLYLFLRKILQIGDIDLLFKTAPKTFIDIVHRIDFMSIPMGLEAVKTIVCEQLSLSIS